MREYKYNLSESEATERLKDAAASVGYEFIGFTENYHGIMTMCSVQCANPLHAPQVKDTRAVIKGTQCRECYHEDRAKALVKPDSYFIEGFKASGHYPEGTKFSRIPGAGYNRWQLECPICSVDEYVQNGLCSGVFDTYLSSLRRGRQPCRCSVPYVLTKDQQQFRLVKHLRESRPNITFVAWADGTNHSNSKALLHCSDHGVFVSRLFQIYQSTYKCRECCDTGFSFADPAKVYVLKVGGPSHSFTGFGITGNLDKRLATHRNELRSYGMTMSDVCAIDCPSGKVAAEVELDIKHSFPHSVQEPKGFRREATHAHLYDEVVAFVQSRLSAISEASKEQCCEA